MANHPPCECDCVQVLETTDDVRLVAARPIAPGERLFRMEGITLDRRARHSLQLDEQLHLDTDEKCDAHELRTRFFWRYINHACEPNVRIDGREVVALRAIAPGEMMTFDYQTTEWELVAPFRCHCGSPRCLGEIRGFKHLTAAQRAALGAVSPHLARRAHLAPAEAKRKGAKEREDSRRISSTS
jgi:hypothetical protein